MPKDRPVYTANSSANDIIQKVVALRDMYVGMVATNTLHAVAETRAEARIVILNVILREHATFTVEDEDDELDTSGRDCDGQLYRGTR